MIDATPLVSIIIPCYNQARFLRSAISSALNQSYENVEVVVVDDGSTDDTPTVVQEFADRVVAIRQRNLGLSGARNTGFEACNGEYIVFLDSDDLLTKRAVEEGVSSLVSHRADLVFFGFAMFTDERDLLHAKTIYPYASKDLATVLCRSRFAVHSLMFSKTLVNNARPFDEKLTSHEDFDFWWQLALQNPVSTHCRLLGALYRQHGDSMSRNVRRMCETRAEVLWRYHDEVLKSSELRTRCGSDFAANLLSARRDIVLTKGEQIHFSRLSESLHAFEQAGCKARVPLYMLPLYRLFGTSTDMVVMTIARPILRWRYNHR